MEHFLLMCICAYVRAYVNFIQQVNSRARETFMHTCTCMYIYIQIYIYVYKYLHARVYNAFRLKVLIYLHALIT